MVKYGEAIKHFFVQLADPSSRVARDVYSYMFLCDFFNFFVILIGYSSFGVSELLRVRGYSDLNIHVITFSRNKEMAVFRRIWKTTGCQYCFF